MKPTPDTPQEREDKADVLAEELRRMHREGRARDFALLIGIIAGAVFG